jgi:site-specific DNA-cytosine methylase
MPTLNAFDNGDVRTTVIVFHPHYHDGARVQGDTMNTLTSRMGTGGNNVSGVATIFSHTQGLDAQPSETVSPTLRAGGAGMAVAYDEFNDSIGDTHHTLRAGTKQSTGVIMESNVRRLTPVECERLQGFPDDWTAGQSDSTRYKQMGNAVAVPVVEWIVQNIVDVAKVS